MDVIQHGDGETVYRLSESAGAGDDLRLPALRLADDPAAEDLAHPLGEVGDVAADQERDVAAAQPEERALPLLGGSASPGHQLAEQPPPRRDPAHLPKDIEQLGVFR